jgi:phenylpropionate dioxygenase-like ring-hydroxylating dioxygenase large terminal subunit
LLLEEDNQLLTRVGPNTPMGNLMRLYWLPVLFSWEVPAGGAPERVRLLGEDLVAFRTEEGTVGLIAERCPHRGASLYFGRNEAAGLRCLYHGWKFDPAGACVDMPSEPPESNFQSKVRTAGYPCRERCGVVWAYMGPDAVPPPLPNFEWMNLPEDHHVAGKRVQTTNWAQAMEGDIDQSHVSYVHSTLNGDSGAGRPVVDQIRAADKHPHFEVLETAYGNCIAAGRGAPDGQRYWRITQQLMPFYSMTGPYGPDPKRSWRAWVPIDDTNAFVIGVLFHPLRPLTEEERERALTRSSVWNISPKFREPLSSQPFGRWRSIATLENDYFQDRDVQRSGTFSGIPEFWAQDAALQVSMGAIGDRTQEHLGRSDLAIIAARRRLLATAKDLRDRGRVPAEIADPDVYSVRADAILLPADASWFEATVERRAVVPGSNPDCP